MARKLRPSLAQRLRDPGQRSKLPMSALPLAMQRERRQNQRVARENADPLLDPTQVLTGHNLAHAARQIAGTELDPQISALDRQSVNTRLQQQGLQDRVASYYRGLSEQEANRHQQMQNLAAMTSKAVAGVGAQTRQDFDTQQQAADTARTSDASSRGQGLQGGNQAAEELAAARQRAGALQGAAETAAAQQGANWTALSDTIGQALQLRGAETQGRLRTGEANALQEIEGKRADLEGQRGGLTAKTLQDLREKGFEDLATEKGLGLKAADLQQRSTSEAANRRVKLAGIRTAAQTQAANRTSRESTSAAGLAERHRHDVAIENKPGKPKPESAQAIALRRSVNNLGSEIQDVAHSVQLPGDRVAARQRVAQVIADRAKRAKQQPPPHDVLSAAIDLALDGHVSSRNRQILRQAGVRIPRSWLPTTTGLGAYPH